MTDYESDLDQSNTILLKPVEKKTKTLTTEKDKKWTTKMMIKDALTELKSRKGVSVYAIKRHLAEKFQADTERLNYVIRKTLKTGVEDGTFIQLKGVGASGSFKLAVVKDKVKKTIKKKKPEKSGTEVKEKKVKKMIDKTDKEPKKPKAEKKVIEKTKQKELIIGEKNIKEVKNKKETAKQKAMPVEDKESKEYKPKKSKTKVAETEEGKKEKKKTKTKMAKGFETPAKKKGAMIKRKSIGSIRKPPKMKPK